MKYFIIDDDVASRRMLSQLISNEYLGEVIGDSGDAIHSEIDILMSQPDIVLIDLLMPNQDGIETVRQLKKKNFVGKFVMISQINNKEMVAEAYNEGIDYFIHKPINRVEVSTVIRKVINQLKMESSLNRIIESLDSFKNPVKKEKVDITRQNKDHVLNDILGDLGILGEGGSNDLVEIVKYLCTIYQDLTKITFNDPLKDIFMNVLETKLPVVSNNELKAFEQRVRRAVNQALINLSSLGLTDYAHPKFEHFATKFFDFNEVRIKMAELEGKKTQRNARINLRKFICALYHEMIVRIEQDFY